MKFEVDTSSLAYTIKSMESELGEVENLAKELYAALTAMDGMWVGTAHDTFAVQYQNDQAVLANMQKTIHEVINGLEAARKNYEHCESSVQTEIKKIAV